MTDAITSNSMIPSNPGIVAQQIKDGAQVVAPIVPGASPIVEPAQLPAPGVESYDFWGGVETRIEPEAIPAQPGAEPVQPVVPAASPTAGQPVVPAADALTPEQHAAIIEAGAVAAPVAAPQPAAAPQPIGDITQQTIAHLAQTEYAMPKEVADKLVSNPEEVYPTLAATMHVRLATQIGQAVSTLLPPIVEKIVNSKLEAQRLENDFFRLYPLLADPRFRPVVAQSLSMARQANPQATREQVMNDGASLAALKLRIAPQAQPVQAQVVAQAQGVQPAQVPVQQPNVAIAPLAVVPFQPAVGGGGALPNVQPELENEFEALANDPNW